MATTAPANRHGNEDVSAWDHHANSEDEENEALANSTVPDDIAYWEYLQDRARQKAARDLERSTRLEHDIDFLDTLDKNNGYVSKYKPPSYFDEHKRRKQQVPGVTDYSPESYGSNDPLSPTRRRMPGLLRGGASARSLFGDEERRGRETPGVGRYSGDPLRSSVNDARTPPLRTSTYDAADRTRQQHQKLVPGPGRYFISGDISKVKIGPVISSAMRGKNEFDLAIERSMEIPAPDAYTIPAIGADIKGGVISTAVPPRSMDLAEAHGKQIPGPSDYMPRQGGVGYGVGGGKISEARPLSDVEVRMLRAKELPGPGEYNVPDTLRKSGGVVSESRIPALFGDRLKVANNTPSPGCYAKGMLKSSLKKNGGKFDKAAIRRYYVDTIEQGKSIPGPGGNTKVQSTLNKSGGVLSTARPKSDVEWRIYRASQIPGPKYNITSPDTQAMERIQKNAKDLYKREYGTDGADPYKLTVRAKDPGLPAHERLYMLDAPKRAKAMTKRRVQSARAVRF